MKLQILAGAAVLALIGGITSSAIASDHGGRRATHARPLHASSVRPAAGWGGDSAYDYSRPRSLGPLGFTFGCGRPGSCQVYSVSAWSY